MTSFDNLCRLCANDLKSGINLLAPENSHLLLNITQSIPITITHDDSYPKSVCFDCHATLINFFQFRDRSVANVSVFETMLQKHDVTNVINNIIADEIKEENLSDVEFYEEPEFKYHPPEILELHENSPEIVMSCTTCDVHFDCDEDFINHLTQHSCKETFECPFCDKCFVLERSLRDHLRLHGQNPFQCNICKKCFSSKRNLKAHRVVHTESRPFICPECHKGFRRKCNLTSHRHLHSAEKLFECEDCGKRFAQNENLRHHSYRYCRKKQLRIAASRRTK